MKTINKFIVTFLCLLLLCSCTKQSNDVVQDDSPITMYVGLGNNQSYYESLQNLIKEELGYDVKFVYTNSVDTSTSALLMFKNNDLPADIMITAAKTPTDYLRDSCVDLMTCSTLVDKFTYQKAKEFTTSEGNIYQIPFTSRLIGITYNQTLMEEMGYQVPNNFEEMLALKKQCDKDGITFAVTAGVATGHGFNYLFHLMGAQWISSLDGSKWFEEFLAGECDSSEFKKQAIYFQKWVENDLFQNFHDSDWQASKEYFESRALFFFDLTSGITTYDRAILDEQGNQIGTSTDKYASMPWISEDGTSNCYTYYDNMYLALNKDLQEYQNKDKLNKCVKILELLTTNKAAELFTSVYLDGYVATNDFVIKDDRTYYKDKQIIDEGYLQPWYYNSFNADTIIATGAVINSYIKDGSKSYDDIFTTLDEYQTMYLNKDTNVLASLDDDLTIKQTAALIGQASMLAYGDCDGCLVPYIDENHPLKPFTQYGVVATVAYKGGFEDNYIDTIIPSKGQKVFGVKLLGSEINELLQIGLCDEDHTYPYLIVGVDEVDENKEYVICINIKSIDNDIYTKWLGANKIILDTNNEVITYKIKDGFYKYFETHKQISGVN